MRLLTWIACGAEHAGEKRRAAAAQSVSRKRHENTALVDDIADTVKREPVMFKMQSNLQAL